MWKACSRCGKIHPDKYTACPVHRHYCGGQERELRNKYAWAKKSKEIRQKANYLCEVCRDQEVYTYDNLEVHHIDKVKDEPTKLLDNLNLVCLCVEHHKQADKGDLSKEYLRGLACGRERE